MKRRRFLRHPELPLSPEHRDIRLWLPVNRNFYAGYRSWLAQSGYGACTLNIYGIAARLAYFTEHIALSCSVEVASKTNALEPSAIFEKTKQATKKAEGKAKEKAMRRQLALKFTLAKCLPQYRLTSRSFFVRGDV